MRRLVLASAGAGKSRLIVEEALKKSELEKSVLILTYTENNQKELLNELCRKNKTKPANITIKGWFTFLLEDMIRPYQNYIFQERIEGINFNDKSPHKIKDRKTGRSINIPGTAEKINKKFNPIHYFKKNSHKVHTINLAKLASRIIKASGKKPIHRLEEIYDAVYIDEVQDLVGYDFDIVKAIFKSTCEEFVCVGDFRQTVYSTSIASKSPKTNIEKLDTFKQIGFQDKHMNISWRCIQPICDFADKIHAAEQYYSPTCSKVAKVPKQFSDHLGIFTIKSSDISNYIELYNPVILRLDRTTQVDICADRKVFNFGESKGLGFERVLIISTEKHRDFISGNMDVFNEDKTEKAKNTLYVVITRAKYSVAFVYDGDAVCNGIKKWIVS